MQIDFKPITIDDKEVITSFTLPSPLRNCDLAFSNMCSWRFLYLSEYAVYKNFLLIRFYIEEKNRKRIAYMRPIGNGDFRDALLQLEEDSWQHGHPLLMLGVTPISKDLLEEAFPGEFSYIPERDYFDYIYLREDLATLKGKKFQAKRNHVNKFKKQYAYEYEPLTAELVPECLEFEAKWYKANRTDDDQEELTDERKSMIFALNHFKELNLLGGAIRIDHKLVAFTFGSPINQDTFGVHVEKADTDYDGAYSIINQEFASRIPEQYVYVNREEDLGIPGLRKAKLSYNPTILLPKAAVIKKIKSE
ncbi:phosphatidylglycerol lysyltransferase domain-containing protein [Parabacteroides sp. AD58]|uniref:Phosphatidylglycerol lysyltransferase domain-containing protein n=1 Tax=Parabacteroides absconsus TaxID=2951805 RepID=A0ABZ2IJU5_9BACT|nr:phosphatidylglycerol lysyltransferase domain-containing protein [Parabacteroides sp. AD58]MCM6902838.1 phosphatidylglycerol lysyltransferase domain-containing protein [Parabacteroides sp. AD58]